MYKTYLVSIFINYFLIKNVTETKSLLARNVFPLQTRCSVLQPACHTRKVNMVHCPPQGTECGGRDHANRVRGSQTVWVDDTTRGRGVRNSMAGGGRVKEGHVTLPKLTTPPCTVYIYIYIYIHAPTRTHINTHT